MSTEVSLSITDVLAALQSQLGQAHADLLLAQADAETLRAGIVSYLDALLNEPTITWQQERTQLLNLSRTAHPGTALADEVALARKIVKWARTSALYAKRAQKGTIDADIDAYDAAVKAGAP